MKTWSLIGIGLLGACTFPEVNITNITPADGGSTSVSTTTAAGGAGSSGSGASGGAATGGDATTTSASGGDPTGGGGEGGAGGSIAVGGRGGEPGQGAGGGFCSGGGSTGGAGGMGACDKDGDSVLAMEFPCCGDDCNDDNPDVFPGQSQHFDQPLPDGTFDYDCDGKDEGDPTQLFNGVGNVFCSGLLCVNGVQGYSSLANCGQLDTSQYFKCQAVTCAILMPPPPLELRCK